MNWSKQNGVCPVCQMNAHRIISAFDLLQTVLQVNSHSMPEKSEIDGNFCAAFTIVWREHCSWRREDRRIVPEFRESLNIIIWINLNPFRCQQCRIFQPKFAKVTLFSVLRTLYCPRFRVIAFQLSTLLFITLQSFPLDLGSSLRCAQSIEHRTICSMLCENAVITREFL